MEIAAAYTSAWFVRHPDGALSAVRVLPTDVRRPARKLAHAMAGKKDVAEGPE